MTGKNFDEAFDDGESIVERLDLSSASRSNLAAKRVNVDFPEWMLRALDRQARSRGVTRQALIKLWLADRLETAAE